MTYLYVGYLSPASVASTSSLVKTSPTTSSSDRSTASSTTAATSERLSVGAVAGFVIGPVVVLLAVFAIAGVLFYRRGKRVRACRSQSRHLSNYWGLGIKSELEATTKAAQVAEVEATEYFVPVELDSREVVISDLQTRGMNPYFKESCI